jgi:uncharacterized membrane protein
MCSSSSQNWIVTATTLGLFAGLVVASVVLLVRSLNAKEIENEED